MPDEKLKESLSSMIQAALAARKNGEGKQYPPRPPTWAPKDPDAILECQIIDSFESKFGVRRIVVDTDGNQWVLPGGFVVVNELIRAKAGIGDVVFLKYTGERKNKAGTQTYKSYQIVVIPKDAFDRTGQKFPTPKPVPKQDAPTAPASQATGLSGAQAPFPAQAATAAAGVQTPEMSKVDEVMKRLAEMIGKLPGGMRKGEFERILKNAAPTQLSFDEIALLYAGLIRVDGDKVLKA